jgi:hypothetical protein
VPAASAGTPYTPPVHAPLVVRREAKRCSFWRGGVGGSGRASSRFRWCSRWRLQILSNITHAAAPHDFSAHPTAAAREVPRPQAQIIAGLPWEGRAIMIPALGGLKDGGGTSSHFVSTCFSSFHVFHSWPPSRQPSIRPYLLMFPLHPAVSTLLIISVRVVPR